MQKKNYYFLFIPVLVLICFSAAFKNGFTNWDDQEYVLNNTAIRSLSLSSIAFLFTHFLVISYHPLTLLSLAINFAISGNSATGYIVTNVLLHIVNCWLVYRLMNKIFNENFSLFVSALFAIHPLMTEPVVWIAGRKDVLYALFYLLALNSYAVFIRSKNKTAYILSLILFICSCLSKAQAVSLCLTLFAFDYAIGERFSINSIKNKIPFLLAGITIALVGIAAQGKNVIAFTGNDFSFFERIAIASQSMIRYLIHVVFPFSLSAFYPYSQPFENSTYVYIPIALLILVLPLYSFRKNRIVIFGILFFILNLILVLQIFPVGDASMADRYMYIPSIGIFMLLVYSLTYLKDRLNVTTPVAGILSISIVLIFAGATFNRSKVWKNGFTLWTDVMHKYPEADIAYVNRGTNYFSQGDTTLALMDYTNAIKINPLNQFAINNAGSIYYSKMDYKKTIQTLSDIDTVKSINLDGLLLRAYAKSKSGDFSSSQQDVLSYLSRSKNAEAYTLAGLNEILLNDFIKAKYYLNAAIATNPTYVDAYVKIGVAQIQTGDTVSSCLSWKKAADMGNTDVIPYLQQYCRN